MSFESAAHPPGTRHAVVDLTVRLDAPVGTVWETLTTPDGLVRWFCTEASVSPGPGGRVAIGWSVGDSFEVPITAWEPGKHLRLDHPPFQMDFFLKGRNGRTALRLVNPTSAAFYRATRSGWNLSLANLRHYLGRHAGQPGASREIPLPMPSTAAEGWARLTGPGGLRIDGNCFAIAAGPGRFRGQVDLIDPPWVFGGALPEWDDALLRISLNYSGEPDRAHLVLRGYGDGAARLDELAASLGPWLGRVLAPPRAGTAPGRPVMPTPVASNPRTGRAATRPTAEKDEPIEKAVARIAEPKKLT
ncbi:MAG TPA: SRPBCC domain-containing protein [Chloroflexota bacterium]|nr:SRPBCC domain-containing protein [Chloroflexota bacterium]